MKTIMLDIDGSKAKLKEALWRIRLLRKILGKHYVVGAVVYKTVHGWHIYLKPQLFFVPTEIILIQALLGSDWLREAYNMKRLREGNFKNWNVLFQKKKNFAGEILSKEKFYCSINYGSGRHG